MKKCLFIALLPVLTALYMQAQTPVGTWVTTDDKRNVNIAHVEIFKKDGKLHGKVIRLLPEARTRTCSGCSGDLKGKSIEGMTMIWDVQPEDDKYWSGGKLLDPNSGRKYDCSIWLDSDDTLKVRASFGISLLGRTQTWNRLKSSKSVRLTADN